MKCHSVEHGTVGLGMIVNPEEEDSEENVKIKMFQKEQNKQNGVSVQSNSTRITHPELARAHSLGGISETRRRMLNDTSLTPQKDLDFEHTTPKVMKMLLLDCDLILICDLGTGFCISGRQEPQRRVLGGPYYVSLNTRPRFQDRPQTQTYDRMLSD